MIRLQKFIADAGITSRRKAEQLILDGHVKVNGKVVLELGTKIDPENDSVKVKNKVIKKEHPGILLMHKPVGFITSKKDPQGRKTVYNLIGKKYQSYITVGRLDYNTSGLLIFTNDGELANLLMHPRNEFIRIYRATVRGSVSEEKLQKLEKGVKLEDGIARGKARILKNLPGKTLLEIELKEGKNRIVRRVMKKLGHPVLSLERIAFGSFKLGKLKKGEVLRLTDKQYYQVKSLK